MSDLTYDFADGTLPAAFVEESGDLPGESTITVVAASSTDAALGTAPATHVLQMLDTDKQTGIDFYVPVTFGASGSLEFDFASGLAPYDSVTVALDSLGNTTLLTFTGPSDWAHQSVAIPAGDQTVYFRLNRTGFATMPQDPYALIANLVFHDATITGSAPPAKSYAKSALVTHDGYLWIALAATTDEPTTASANWARAAIADVTALPGWTLPVRAGQTSPFATGEAGLWVVLDGTGAMTGTQYVSGA